MSTDRWSVCPGCEKKAEQARAELLRRVEVDYGKIPVDEYKALVEQSMVSLVEIQMQSLHEDWEIGIYSDHSDEFVVDYRARCEECGFSYAFKHEEKVVDDSLDLP